MSSGGSQNTTSTTSGPPAAVMQNYSALVDTARNVASSPLQQYTGPLVSGFSPDQLQAFSTVENAQGIAAPYLNAAAQEFGVATTPMNPENSLPWQWTSNDLAAAAQYANAASSIAGGTPNYQSTAMGLGNTGAGYGGMGAAIAGQTPTYQAGATAPINLPGYDQLPTYFNPYQQQVTDTTRALFNEQNAERQAQIQGDATSRNAYGGDREAVAQALATQQENLAQAPVLANIQQQGFAQAQQELNQQQQIEQQRQAAMRQFSLGAGQLGLGAAGTTISAAQPYLQAGQLGLGAGQLGLGQAQTNLGAGQLYLGAGQGYAGLSQQNLAAQQANAWLASQAAFGLGALGSEAQNLTLGGANALLGTGAMQQGMNQQQLNIPYEQFLQQQAYPYQSLGFLAPIVEGTGSLSGGMGSTTSPGPSALSQVAGLGLTGLGVAGLGQQQGWWGSTPAAGFGTDAPAIEGVNSFGGGGDFGFGKRGGRAGSFDMGGRIGLAGGGAPTIPHVPGIPDGVPNLDLSYIPQAAPGGIPSSMGLHLGNETTTTQSGGGGGGGILGDLGSAIGIGSKIAGFFVKDGGRIAYDTGGGIANPTAVPGSLPPVPPINLDYIVHPGPAVKGSGPPHPPSGQSPDSGGFGIKDGMGILNATKQLKGAFGSSTDSEGAAYGGRMGYDTGGSPGVPASAAIAFGGAPPNVEGQMQQLLEMPLNRLEEMAVQFPPQTQTGQMIARAISQKKATVGAGTMPNAGAPAMALGASPMATAGMGMGMPQAPQNTNGTASPGYADGGQVGYVTEDELDPVPEVDHSGDTVKVRYPSEGKVLDLGLPSIKSHHRRAGGGAAPFMSSVRAANGIDLPQISSDLYTGGAGRQTTDFLPTQNFYPNWGPQGYPNPMGAGSPNDPAIQARAPVFQLGMNHGLLQRPSLGGAAPAAPDISAPPPFDINAFLASISGGDAGGSSGKRGGRFGRIGYEDGGPVAPMAPPGPLTFQDKLARIDQLTADRLAAERGQRAAGSPSRSFSMRATGVPHLGYDDGGDVGDDSPSLSFSNEALRVPGTGTAEALAAHEGELRSRETPLLFERASSNIGAPNYNLRFPDEPPKAGGALASRVASDKVDLGGMGLSGNLDLSVPPPRETRYASGLRPQAEPQAAEAAPEVTRVTGAAPAEPPANATAPTNAGPLPPDARPAGERRLPPGTPINSKGEPYSPGLAKQTPQEKAAVETSMRYIHDAQQAGRDPYAVAGQPAAPAPMGMGAPPIAPIPQVTGVGAPPTGIAAGPGTARPAIMSSGESIRGTTTGPVTPDLVKQAGYQKDPEGYASLANYLWKGEASNFNILYGGKPFSGYDQHPADKGWQGGYGPAGPTHAAGLPQFQPGTWHDEQRKLGLADFSPPNQVHAGLDLAETEYRKKTGGDLLADFKAGKLDQINSALKPTWTSLGTGSVAGPAKGGTDPLVGPGTGRPGMETPTAQPASGGGMGVTASEETGMGMGRHREDRHGFSLADYSMPLMIAGLSTLGSRSPNALAEGFKAAAPYFTANERAQTARDIADVRSETVAQKNQLTRQHQIDTLQKDAASLQFKYDNMTRLQQAGDQSLELKRQAAETKAAIDAANLQLKALGLDQKTDQIKRQTKPLPGYDKDENGNLVVGTHEWDDQKGAYVFKPGATVGHAPQETGQVAILHEMVKNGLAKDIGEAQKLQHAYKQNPDSAMKTGEYVRAVQAEERRLQSGYQADVTNVGKKAPDFRAQAEKNVRGILGNLPAAPAASAAQPATPAAAPAAPAAPAVPDKLKSIQLKGYSPSTGFFYGTDGKKYDKDGNPAE